MHTDNSIKFFNWQAGEVKSGILAVLAGFQIAAEDFKRSRAARIACWVILAVLGLTLWTLVTFRVAQRDAERNYETWRERYVNDFVSQQEAAQRGMPIDPIQVRKETQIKMLAQVLYGVKDNSEQDLRTMCWCVFNRVDSPDYPNTLEEVIAQPKQWMRYSENNAVLDSLYKIAEQELNAWENGKTRPITSDFVYMDWTPTQITLRNQWEYGRGTGTWRYTG